MQWTTIWCADVRRIKDVCPLTFMYGGLTVIFTLFFFFSPDPAFVGSAYIQESLPKGNLVGDDDKIYFFFSEAGKEFDFFDNTIVSRIARVCKVRDAFKQIVHLKGVLYRHSFPSLWESSMLLWTSCVFVFSVGSYLLEASDSVNMMDVAPSLFWPVTQILLWRENIPLACFPSVWFFFSSSSTPSVLIVFHQIFVFRQRPTQ